MNKLQGGRVLCPKCNRKGVGYAAHAHAFGWKDYTKASCRYCNATFKAKDVEPKPEPIKRKLGRLKRGARLRPVSKKRAKRNREATKIRREFCEGIDCCDLCQRPGLCLVAHEIARGNRVMQFTEPACQLALCNGCHDVVHTETKLWTKVRQLVLLKLRRPAAFDLSKYNRLAIAKVHDDDVDAFDGDPFASFARRAVRKPA